MEFHPKGGDGAEPLPFSLAAVISTLRDDGILPAADDPTVASVQVTVIGPDGHVKTVLHDDAYGPPEPGSDDWVLRHLTFDDPPVGLTPEKYRELLAGAVREAEDLQEYMMAMVAGLARDLVISHDVPVHVAIPAVIEFARETYEQFGGDDTPYVTA